MSDTPVVVAVVAGHGRFAQGLISAVDQITGRGNAFAAVSNVGLGPADIEAAIGQALEGAAARIVFTDLPAGSCTMAARRLQRAQPDVLLVTGTNVAVLMEFLFAVEGPLGTRIPALAELTHMLQTAADKARHTLTVHSGSA